MDEDTASLLPACDDKGLQDTSNQESQPTQHHNASLSDIKQPQPHQHQQQPRHQQQQRQQQQQQRQQQHKQQQEGLDLSDVMHSINSFNAVALPVFLAMSLATFAVLYLNDPQSAPPEGLYLVYTESASDSSGTKFEHSMVNAMAIVSVFAPITFFLVLLYWLNCMKILLGYMLMSLAMLLAVMGGGIVVHDDYGNAFVSGLCATALKLARNNFSLEENTYYLLLWNFAAVGIIAIFYQKGLAPAVAQGYLIFIAVVMAWQISRVFPEWTTWAMLFFLSLYDLAAVLCRYGPLRILVGLVQQEGRPLPGLLYEAEVEVTSETAPRTPAAGEIGGVSADEKGSRCGSDDGSARTAGSNGAVVSDNVGVELSLRRRDHGNEQKQQGQQPQQQAGSSMPALPGATPPPPMALSGSRHVPPRMQTTLQRRLHPVGGSGDSTMEHGSVLYHFDGSWLDFLEIYYRENAPSRLEDAAFDVGALADNWATREPQLLETLDAKYGTRYARILAPFRDWVEEDRTIKLGLGDFIFYSVLVSRAARSGDWVSGTACLVVIEMGLGGTLFLLAVFRKALPALPISIGLGLVCFLLTRFFAIPWLHELVPLGVTL